MLAVLQAKDACYVLVRTSTEGFDLYQRLVDAGVPARVAPAPHGMQACCGTSVLLDPEVVDAARPVIEAAPYPIEPIVREFGLVHSKFARMRKPKLANGKLRYMLA